MAEREPVPERTHEKYHGLLDSCRSLPPTPTAVAHPCDQSSLEGAVDAARLGLISPILVGPRSRIEAAARQYAIDIAGLPIVDAPFSHASAEQAVAIVREGKAEALMKGSLHTDELMGAVVKRDTGLRTARRVSHCFVMDVPTYPEPLIITDAAVNIAPTLEEKVDIVQNAIDLAHALGAAEVRVAILSAMETVNPKVPSTIEAAALCKMADRGQITGRDSRRAARARQCDQPGVGQDQEDQFAGGGPRQRVGGARSRSRQHAREKPVVSRRRRCRRHRARRARSDHSHQPRRLGHDPPCFLRGRGADGKSPP